MIKSCCGFDCGKCPLYIASITNDQDMHKCIEDKYGLDASMTCHGCLSNEINTHCNKCGIRKCCLDKGIENCGKCDIYPDCKTIGIVINTNMESKEFLDEEKNKKNKL